MPPDESPYLHTGFHFEFHSLKEETLFIATPQSHFVRQLPGRGALWCGTNSVHSAVPLAERAFQWGYGVARGPKGRNRNLPWPLGKKGYNVALGSMFVLTPSENSLTANFQLPLRGSLLVYFINSCDKPPSPREEDFAKQKTEGVGLPPQFSPNR